MENSIFLAKVFGLAGSISTFLIVIRYPYNLKMEIEAGKNPSGIYLSGFMFLLLGVLVVVSHNVWELSWRVIITILGWMLMLKGIMRILMVDRVIYLIEKKKANRYAIIPEIISFLIFLFLLYKGFSQIDLIK